MRCGGGGDSLNRKRGRREWDVEGWREWEMVIDEMGGEQREEGEGMGGNSAAEPSSRGDRDGVGDVMGEGMDGGGCGGRRQREKLPLKDPISRRVPLRGRRRGAKAEKEKDDRMLGHQMLKWLDSARPKDT